MQLLLLSIPDVKISLPDTENTVPDADITVSDEEASKDVTVPSAELYYALDAEAVVVPAAEADARSVVVYLL